METRWNAETGFGRSATQAEDQLLSTHAQTLFQPTPGTDSMATNMETNPATNPAINTETSIVPYGYWNFSSDDFKHLSMEVKQGLQPYQELITRDRCRACGMANPTEFWACCVGQACFGCEGCKDRPEQLVRQNPARGNKPATTRCCLHGCKSQHHECLPVPRRNFAMEALIKSLKTANVNLSEAIRQDGMQVAARNGGIANLQAAAEQEAAVPRGRANGRADGKKRKADCTAEEWAEHQAGVKARKVQREQDKMKLSLFDGMERELNFLRDKAKEHDEDAFDEWMHEFNMEEAAANGAMEMDDDASDAESGDAE